MMTTPGQGGGRAPRSSKLRHYCFVRDQAERAMREVVRGYARTRKQAPQLRYQNSDGLQRTVPLRFEDFADLVDSLRAESILSVFRSAGQTLGHLALNLAESSREAREAERKRWPAAVIDALSWVQPKLIIIVQDHVGNLIAPRPAGAEDALVVVAINQVKAVAVVVPRVRFRIQEAQVYESTGGDRVIGGAFAKFYSPPMG
ncbi:MAG: hypothetical protein A2V88_04790 [Elusimicrobia bacterium RBG_16_66_12]|nr:MAG: hypothetical protein A2V88_04790 [Elusimicrobia bacterium RBG_16_66_12]